MTEPRPGSEGSRLLAPWQRIALIPLGLIGAVAATIHAGSENGIKPLAATEMLELSLNDETRSRVVDARYRAELSQSVEAGLENATIAPEIAIDAERAFATRPLDVSMISVLASGKVAPQDPDRAFELMQRVAELNRRDSIANLWLIREYGNRGEVQPMLSAFDQAMRTDRDVRTNAMPAFVGMLALEEGRPVIRDLLSASPDWEPEFWTEFARNPAALVSAREFFGAGGYDLASLDDEYREPIFRGLKRVGLYESLFSLATETGQAEASVAEEKSFVSTSADDPFGWELTSTGKYVTHLDRDQKSLLVSAEPGSFGAIAERLVRLDNEAELTVSVSEPLGDGVRLEGRLICADESRSTVGQAILNQGAKSGRGTIVKQSCNFATLALILNVEARRQDVTIEIQEAGLLR
ncbi:hypothetical protein [Qipengyuania aquimaris]|uniref:hypothetical protein n=1 Tax=Qipengyuania aquimaris TaxID=255984 RepID=UPI001FD20CBF|nr:hypothetical protein [Qipengyuania aquimaris]UOR14981.1 hypothetical protein LCM05_10910 [Qipengyuania aquimaris]